MSERLNFGCGSIQPIGWINLDADKSFNAQVNVLDQLDGNTFDCIAAHCSIQTNDFHAIPALLKDFHRVLKPGGTLRISLPDILEGFHAYNTNHYDFFPNGEKDIDIKFSAWLTWYSTTKTLLTPKALIILLQGAGFKDIVRLKFGHSQLEGLASIDTRENECYFIEATK